MKFLFKKGNKYGRHVAWNKGIPCTIEQKKHLSIANTGKHMSEESKEKARKKLHISMLGNTNGKKNKSMVGRFGDKHPRWIKDRTKLAKKQERNDSAYKDWRRQVWIRDNFKCKIDNPNCSGRLEAHHILGFKKYPELRYDINNGITLCHFHHPRVREEEKRLIPTFKELVSVSKD